MSLSEGLICLTFPAAVDMTNHQYKFVDINDKGQAALVATANAKAVGVSQDTPAASGRALRVGILGRTKIKIGGAAALSAGALVMSDSSGEAIVAAGSGFALGIMSTGGAAYDIADMIYNPMGKVD